MRALAPALALATLVVALDARAVGPAPPPPPPSQPPRPSSETGKSSPPPAPRTGGSTGTPSTGAPPSSGSPPPPGTIPPPPPKSGGDGPPAAEVEPQRPVDLSDTWSYAGRGASQPRYVRSGETVEVAPNPEGYYSGVSIEGNHVPPFPARSLGSKPALLTWTGFERTSGGSRVFFELSADVATKLDIRGATITLRMSNTRINVRNNARILDLRWFRTPVRSVKVSRRGRDTVATVVLKRDATPTLAVLEGKEGYRLLVLEFAGGEPAEAPVEAP